MWILYDLGIRLMGLAFRLAAPFNSKASLWVSGRRDIFSRMKEAITGEAPLVWFHSASLGEFEQGRPLIEAFRAKHPDYKILLTFFSPSGYEVRKNYAGADYIFYLPQDTRRNAKKFIAIAKPRVAVFIKYEFWGNYLRTLRESGCRTYIISAIFRRDSAFFRWYGGWYRGLLGCFDHLFVQDRRSMALLRSIKLTNVTQAGDTRFDRVAAIASAAKRLPAVESFAAGKRVFIAGSTWEPDEEILTALMKDNPGVKFIVAPHEIDNSRIERLIAASGRKAVRYTLAGEGEDLSGAGLLIIDTIGILSSVYSYGGYAYIGGGFGAGIHNTLEAAAFGLPLAFGPNYRKFKEAVDLIGLGGAVSVSNYADLYEWFKNLTRDELDYGLASSRCRDYVKAGKGATESIMRIIS